MDRLTLVSIFLFIWPSAHSTKFPNDVLDQPVITCGQETISISVKTSDAKASKIFAKGQHDSAGCAFEDTNNATFSLADCNMNRQRQLTPKGLSYSIVVVVQLHPQFITKVDRAYHLRCFYMEADKAVTATLDVSMLTTESLRIDHEMPKCLYNLRSGGPNGAAVKYASIGDKVWHVWECPSDVYGMLVHSCFVTDGAGNRIPILDENGCGVDRYVLATPNYATDLNSVQQETHVFKFADRISVAFNCQIRLCVKEQDGCQGISPPSCTGDNNFKNERLVSLPVETTDIVIPSGATDIESNNQNDSPITSQSASDDVPLPTDTAASSSTNQDQSPTNQNDASPSQDVASSTQDVASFTQDVASSTQDFASSTQDVASSTQDVASSTQDVASSTQDVASSLDFASSTQDAEVTNQDVSGSSFQNAGSSTQEVKSSTQDVESNTSVVSNDVSANQETGTTSIEASPRTSDLSNDDTPTFGSIKPVSATEPDIVVPVNDAIKASRTQRRPVSNSIHETANDSQTTNHDPITDEALLRVENGKTLPKDLENSMKNLLDLNDPGSGMDVQDFSELKIARDQPFLDAYFADPTLLDTRPRPLSGSLTRRSLVNDDSSLELDINQEMFVLEPVNRKDGRLVDSLLSVEEDEPMYKDGICLNQLSLILIVSISILLFILCSGLLFCLFLKRKRVMISDSEICFKDAPHHQNWQAFYSLRLPFYGDRR